MLILLALLLVLLFFGLGFAVHVLWILAVILFVAWLIGLIFGRGERRGKAPLLPLVTRQLEPLSV